MADIVRINQIIKDRGLKKAYIAEQLGISINGITNKLNGRSEFKAGEVAKICEVLSINDPQDKIDIFLR